MPQAPITDDLRNGDLHVIGLTERGEVIHDASGSYYGTPDNVNNGHPADKIGWAVQAGGQLNLPGDDLVGFNICYSQGAVGFCTRQGSGQLYNASTSVAAGWIADGVFTLGTDIQLTRAWSTMAGYQHIWNPMIAEVAQNERAADVFLLRLSLTF